MSSLDDVDFAVDFLRDHGAAQVAILQCTAKYPAPLDALNLRVIPGLIERYGVPCGLSDHSRDPVTAPSVAVALGASVVEKHFTLHNRLPGADHPFALTPDELIQMVQAVRATESALGEREKNVEGVEVELAHFARRGLQAIREISRGEPLRLDENVGILRPGKHTLGLHPRYIEEMEGRPSLRTVHLGEGITRDVFTNDDADA